jgi:hypothetical protein
MHKGAALVWPTAAIARLPRAAHNSLITRGAPWRGPRGGDEAVASLQRALSWLIVLIVGLAPMLIYYVAGVVRRAIRRKTRRLPAGSAPGRAKDDCDR